LNKDFKQGQIVKFINKSKVYNLDNKTEFEVLKGTTGEVILDEDAGEIGSCKIKLNNKKGESIIIECDDSNLQIAK